MYDDQVIDTDMSATAGTLADGLLDMQLDARLHIECLSACWLELQTLPAREGVARSIKTVLLRQHAVHDALQAALAECRAAGAGRTPQPRMIRPPAAR